MNEHGYRTTISVPATPEAAFAAINDVRAWWSQDVDGPTDTLDAEFAYRGNHEGVNVHRAQIRVTELVPGQRVAWHVLDNWMSFIDDQAEWTDTRIVFEIAPTADGSEIRFSHLGLVPAYECFEVCLDAWTFFLQDSLRGLLATGSGQPMERLTPAPYAESA
ncbi:MAG: SRPBCC domain-containing protein [Nocardioidaceae bacterium]